MVGFAGETFAGALFVVQTFAVLFLEALDVLVLRHRGGFDGVGGCERGCGGFDLDWRFSRSKSWH